MSNIVYLSGYARSGKGTVADFFINQKGYTKFSFADKVKEVAKTINIKVIVNGHEIQLPYWDGKDESKRFPCVEIGHKLRGLLGEDVWVNALRNSAPFKSAVAEGKNIVIDDVRYLNEFSMLDNNPNYVSIPIYIERSGVLPAGAEAESFAPIFDNIKFNYKIVNNFHTVELLHNELAEYFKNSLI